MKLPNKSNLAIIVFIVAAVAAIALASNNNSNANDQNNNQGQEQKAEDQRNKNKQAAENKEEEPKEEAKEEAKTDEKAEENKQEKDQEQPAEENNEQSSAANSFEYTAQAGDSYSLMARKAVQTYGLTNNVNLSEAQILFAETNITRAANSPEVNRGQKVVIGEATVKEWVEKAENLSDAAKKAWQAYTVGVNFNTDAVGEARS